MKRKHIRHLCDCLINPSNHVHELSSPLVEEGSLHRQVCLASWSMEYRERITPKVVLKLLDKIDDLKADIQGMHEDAAGADI